MRDKLLLSLTVLLYINVLFTNILMSLLIRKENRTAKGLIAKNSLRNFLLDGVFVPIINDLNSYVLRRLYIKNKLFNTNH